MNLELRIRVCIISGISLFAAGCGKMPESSKSSEDAKKIAQLEERIRQLEHQNTPPSPDRKPELPPGLNPTTKALDVAVDDLTTREGPITLQVFRAIIGYGVVKNGFYYDLALEKVRNKNLELVYFDVSVHNQGTKASYICDADFTMEAADGVLYNGIQTLDGFNTTMQSHAKVRGGVGFALPKGTIFKTLVYNSYYQSPATGEKLNFRVNLDPIASRTGPVQ